jgi:hypothetical protein
MRICYFIQNHLGPAQVCRLARAIRRSQPEAFILVAHDGFAGHCSAGELRQALDVEVFALREPARRGYFSLLQPYFDAIEWLSDHDVPYDWIVYLSAQDYPTQPLRDFEALLATSGCDGFLRYWDACSPVNPWGRRKQGRCRYYFQYFDAPPWISPALRLLRWGNRVQSRVHCHLVYGCRVGVRWNKPPFEPAHPCYAGTQWTTLSRGCAEYIAENARGDTPLIRWFRRTICPDEAVIQTLLVNSGRFHLRNDDLRYADFAGSTNGRPRLLTARDLPAITESPYYFARKFDLARDAGVLDLLDARIG